MEKKQLNFNAPLLSVRKSGPILGSSDKANKKIVEKSPPTRQHSLPIKNSDWELGEVTKAAAVPFLWEKIPGRPKGESDGRTDTPKRSSSTPRLPPGRVADVRRNSGERPVDQNTYKSQWRNSGERPIDQTTCKSPFEVNPLNDHAALLESLRESIYANGESDLEGIDDAYSDALDTLSPAESLSLNCSISGLSGYEVPDVKPSGTFNVDQQTRDFMMSRFLPAAKAVVIETSQYIPRKQSISAEQSKLSLVAELTKQVKKVTADGRKPLLDQYKSNLILSNTRYTEDVKSDAQDDEHGDHRNDRGNERGQRSGKAWGFFPRLLCVKKSLCLLNPVPVMKPKTQVPKSTRIDVSRLTRKAYSGPLDKPTWDPSKKKIFHSGVLSGELHRVETRVYETNQLSYSSASYKAGGLSPGRPFRTGGISPYRNSRPQSPFSKGASFLGMPKEVENLTTQKCSSSNKKCSNSADPPSPCARKQEAVSSSNVAEKTLYIDSVNSENPIKDLASSEAAMLVNFSAKNLETLARNGRKENSPTNCRVQEARSLDIINAGTKADPKSSVLQDSVLTSSRISKVRGIADRYEDAKIDQSINQEPRLDCMNNQPEAHADSIADTLQSPQPPPLPKSPSESWLWRTVPSVHLHNPFSLLHRGNHYHCKNLGQKASTTGAKWETIVKTSNVHHDLGRYSEELSPHIAHKQDRR